MEKDGSMEKKRARWKDFQYLIAHCYPGSVHPRQLEICFSDAAQSQDVLMPLILDNGSCVCMAVCSVFGFTEFEEPTVYDMVATKEKAAAGGDVHRPQESYYCGLDDCDQHGRCQGPRSCPRWKDLQYLIAHASPDVGAEDALEIQYRAKTYDPHAQALFSSYMGALVGCIQAVFEHYEEFGPISVRLSK